jgi:multidrug resistance protein, MATE family
MAEEAAVAAITHRRILRIALPIVISNATVPLLGVVDTWAVGQIPQPEPIGAVGIGAIVLTAVTWVFGFLRMGTAGLTAQAAGAGQAGEVAALLTRALMIGAAGGLVIVALQGPLFAGAFALAPASDAVEALARDYMGIRVWSAPAAIALYGITGWLIAQERTRAVLVLQVAMNGINMGLDILFVIGFGWGVTGVAWATFIAEWSGLALGLWLCRAAFGVPAWRDWGRVFDAVRLRRMGAVNGDILLRSLMLETAFVSMLFLASGLGDVRLAATQILLQFLHVTAYALDGFAFSAEALVGQATGARARAALRRGAVLASLWGGAMALVLAAGFALIGPWAIGEMTRDPEVAAAARSHLPWMVAAPLAGLAAWMLDGIFIGATRTADMRNMMAVSLAVYALAAWALVPPFGAHGLWAAMLIMFATRGVTLGLRYPALERAAA